MGTNAKCSDARYLVAIGERASVANISLFVDPQVRRRRPRLEVSGYGREAWRAAPGSARLL
jgi:hypothetical protein